MAFKIRTRMQEDNLIKVDEYVDEKKDKVLMQLSKIRPKSERIKAINDIRDREKQCLKEQDLLEAKEKMLQQAEKKKLKKARKLLSQKGKKGRKKVDEENELEVESENFDIGRSLEQYDQLVH
jgi:hypothetical protein